MSKKKTPQTCSMQTQRALHVSKGSGEDGQTSGLTQSSNAAMRLVVAIKKNCAHMLYTCSRHPPHTHLPAPLFLTSTRLNRTIWHTHRTRWPGRVAVIGASRQLVLPGGSRWRKGWWEAEGLRIQRLSETAAPAAAPHLSLPSARRRSSITVLPSASKNAQPTTKTSLFLPLEKNSRCSVGVNKNLSGVSVIQLTFSPPTAVGKGAWKPSCSCVCCTKSCAPGRGAGQLSALG